MLKSALFCGVVRNGGAALQRTLDRLELVRSKFLDSKFFIVTNDNTDTTDEVLNAWNKISPSRNIVIRVNGLLQAFPNRIDRICAARNFYLREIQREIEKLDWSYLIVSDLDGPNENLDVHWFDNLEILPISWDGIFANQSDCYYDVYALRHETWCPEDCWVEAERSIPILSKKIPRLHKALQRKAVKKFVFSRQHKVLTDQPPIKVKSAFGGLGIYRTESIKDVYYGSRRDDGKVVCEHVLFNEEIVRRGGSLYIVPSLLNAAPAEHIGKNSGSKFPAY